MSEWKSFSLGEVANIMNVKNISGKKLPYLTVKSGNYVDKGSKVILVDGENSGEIFSIKEEGYLGSTLRKLNIYKNVDEDFIMYFIATKKMLYSTNKTGTAIPHLSKDIFYSTKINLPPLETQKKIVAVLSALDDKIELNNAINKNLEEQAQTIFDNFFYDKWNNGNFSVSSLDKIAEYLNGLAMQKFRPKENETGLPVLKIKELRQGFCDKESDSCSERIKPEFIIHAGDVIFSWSGTLLIDFWCGGLCGLNQHLFKVTSKSYGKWFYYLWTKYHLKRFIKLANDMATTMGHIKRKALTDSKVLIPDRENYLRLEKILQPICDKIIANRLENKKLGELRDTLLPKLMSGEIDVSEVEI